VEDMGNNTAGAVVSVVGGGSSQALAFNFHLGFPTWNLFAPPMAGRCCHQEVGCQGCVVCGGASLRAADAAARTLNPDQAWACPLRALRSMASGFSVELWSLVCDLGLLDFPSAPKRRALRTARVSLPPLVSFFPSTCQPLDPPACELPEEWPQCCLVSRRHSCADGRLVHLTFAHRGRKGPPCRHSFDPLLPRHSLDLSSISFSRLSPARRKTRKGPLEGCASIRHHTPRTLSRLPSVINPLCREGAVLSIWSTYVVSLPPPPVCWLRHRHRASNLSVSPT
jgi:hypothetical protein